MKKGLVVVFCSPSQNGKDFIMKTIMERLTKCHSSDFSCKPAIVYKTREKRVDDAPHFVSIKSLSDLPLQETDKMIFSYGNQQVCYNKREIDEAVNNGDIVFIATCIPQLARHIKQVYGNNSLNIFIRGDQRSEKEIALQEAKRYGESAQYGDELSKKHLDTAAERMALFDLMKDEYISFMQDGENGADYIMTNMFTIFRSTWSSRMQRKIDIQLDDAELEVLRVYRAVNEGKTDWRENKSLLSGASDRHKEPFDLKEDFHQYYNEAVADGWKC